MDFFNTFAATKASLFVKRFMRSFNSLFLVEVYGNVFVFVETLIFRKIKGRLLKNKLDASSLKKPEFIVTKLVGILKAMFSQSRAASFQGAAAV